MSNLKTVRVTKKEKEILLSLIFFYISMYMYRMMLSSRLVAPVAIKDDLEAKPEKLNIVLPVAVLAI